MYRCSLVRVIGRNVNFGAFSIKCEKSENIVIGLVKHGKKEGGVEFGHFQIS